MRLFARKFRYCKIDGRFEGRSLRQEDLDSLEEDLEKDMKEYSCGRKLFQKEIFFKDEKPKKTFLIGKIM